MNNNLPDEPSQTKFHRLLNQGLQCLNTGRLVDAKQCVKAAIGIYPESTQANFLLGLTQYYLGNHSHALSAFLHVLKYDDKNGAAWAHCAEIYVISEDRKNAQAALQKAIQYQDGTANVQHMIGLVQSLLNKHETALSWYQKALVQQANNPGLLLNHATCLMYLGKLDDAESMLKSLIEIQPSFANAHWLLSGLKKAKDFTHVTEMQTLLSRVPYSPLDIAYIQYACGKELEDMGQWPQAFDAFSKAAEAKRKTVNYDESAEIAIFEGLEQKFTEQWMHDTAEGYDDDSPIFVLGEPRSGTTLVERVICAHSMVHSSGELRNFASSISKLANIAEYTNIVSQTVDDAIVVNAKELGKTYINSVEDVRGKTPHFVDKLPSNYLLLPLILKALPRAKIIHLSRDPMDTCFSGFKQLFTKAYPYSYDQQEMARHHARYLKLMSIWRKRFGSQYFEVKYEDLAHNLEANARRIIEFLGLKWEPACLQFHQQTSAVTTASSVQVRQTINTRSIGRWKKYETQLVAMLTELEKHR